MTISRSTLPYQSSLRNGRDIFDYTDSFQGTLSRTNISLCTIEIAKAFFSSAPDWVEKLLAFRNRLVSIFGLKIPRQINNKQSLIANFRCEPGEQLGLFRVYRRTNNEVILGEDDRHLDFRVSLFLDRSQNDIASRLVISTTVKYHNWFGRLYFLPVKPFHKLIVRAMLKRMIQQLDGGGRVRPC